VVWARGDGEQDKGATAALICGPDELGNVAGEPASAVVFIWRAYNVQLFTPSQLQAGRMWVFKEFTRLSSILKRAPYHLDHPLYFAGLSIGRRKACKQDLRRYPDLVSHTFAQETYAAKGEKKLPAESDLSRSQAR
jgi:hypothetical protein